MSASAHYIHIKYKDCGGISINNNFGKRLAIATIWIIIAVGIYQCGVAVNPQNELVDEKMIDKQKQNENQNRSQKWSEDNAKYEDPLTVEKPAILPFDYNIRVLIKSSNFNDIFHNELRIAGTDGIEVELEGEKAIYAPNEEVRIAANDFINKNIIIHSQNQGKVKLLSVGRSGDTEYRGVIEAYGTESGIVIVNELAVEEYLYGVVPSEMPSSYPMEALKAQAIGARTYAYFHKKEYAYPEWRAHVDDSTTFQVYLNIPETDAARQAVDETKDLVMSHNGGLIQSFYYSTSGGYSAGNGAWSTGAFIEQEDDFLVETGEDIFTRNNDESEQKYKEYIDNGNINDIEYNEPWYRWEYVKAFDDSAKKEFLERLYSMYISQPDKVRVRSRFLSADKLVEETQINNIRVLTRQKSGLISSLMIETPNFTVNIRTQNSIRQALAFMGDTIIKNDGSQYKMGNILPSAYFYIEKSFDNNAESGNNLREIRIHGAGMGHGVGMSQNGAKCLALKGFTALQILAYYYRSSIETISDWS